MSDVGESNARHTPEFLIWAIERRCELRDIEGFEQPERTDRQLRAILAVSDARREMRMLQGLCVARTPTELAIPSHAAEPDADDQREHSLPQAFRVDDALTLFGGSERVQQNCNGCPANAEAQLDSAAWAGCYGIVPLTQPEAFCRAFAAAINAADVRATWEQQFETTSPEWYGAWLTSPLSPDRAVTLRQVIEKLHPTAASSLPGDPRAIAALHRGLATAVDWQLPLHAAIYPRGEVVGRWWTLASCCPRCHATLMPDAKACDVCGWSGKFGTAPKRRARGTRPYRPLSELLQGAALVEFLSHYERRSAQNDAAC